MTTVLPKNFQAQLYYFTEGWVKGKEAYDFFAKKSENGKDIRVGWYPCRDLTTLIGYIERFWDFDLYITSQRYTQWVTRTWVQDGKARVEEESVRDSSCIIDQAYLDIDPKDGEVDASHEIEQYQRLRSELADSAGSPVRLYYSGRGWHVYLDFDKTVPLSVAREIQLSVACAFNIRLDPQVRMSYGRQLRIPYTRNSRTGNWALSVGPRMTLQGLRNATRSSLEDGCHWERKHRASPEVFLRHHPGKEVLRDFEARLREESRRKMLLARERTVKEIWKLQDEGLTLEQVADKLCKTVPYLNGLLRQPWAKR